MKKARLSISKTIPLGVFLLMLLLAPSALAYYPWGDVNGDGWCNIADLATLNCFFRGLGIVPCLSGADVNGSGVVNGIDATYLASFLTGGAAPIGECTDYAPCEECDEEAIIWLGTPVYSLSFMTAAIPMYIANASSAISAYHFALKYDPAYVSSISITLAVPGTVYTSDRLFCAATGERLFTVGYVELATCNGTNFSAPPPMTKFLDIVVNCGTTRNTMFNLCITDEDSIGGPARMYMPMNSADNGKCFSSRCRFMVAGDANGEEIYSGADITYGVRALKAIGPPPVLLNCCCIPLKF
jgi:hypothetical protein